ncbi:MAG: B12-binding domain-containing radical SAM protein [Gemmatimonadales bacterium]
MRLYLISATHYQRDRSLVKTTRYWTSGLTLPLLKALTPRNWHVRLTDELMSEVDLEHPCDVVGITAMGPQIARAYDLADAFRARGRKVVIGGAWASLAPLSRSLEHADAVVVGEAERVWAQCLADLAAGRAQREYRDDTRIDLALLPVVDYRDLQLVRWTRSRVSPVYRQYFHWPVLFSRGCPRPCGFCAVQTLHQRTFRTRPIEHVIDDVRRIKSLGGHKLLFLDDNPIADRDAAAALFHALIAEKVIWTSQCPIEIARDRELLDLAARSGCVSLSIGLESTDADVLKRLRKGFNRPARYAEDLAELRRRGILVIALMMVGLDGQTTSVFPETLDFLLENRIALLKLFTPAPYPGTRYHEQMRAAGRILDEDWSHYDYGSVLVQPTGMSCDELRTGFDAAYRDFYSLRSIARRMLPLPARNRAEHAAYLIANLKTHFYLRKHPSTWGTLS